MLRTTQVRGLLAASGAEPVTVVVYSPCLRPTRSASRETSFISPIDCPAAGVASSHGLSSVTVHWRLLPPIADGEDSSVDLPARCRKDQLGGRQRDRWLLRISLERPHVDPGVSVAVAVEQPGVAVEALERPATRGIVQAGVYAG